MNVHEMSVDLLKKNADLMWTVAFSEHLPFSEDDMFVLSKAYHQAENAFVKAPVEHLTAMLKQMHPNVSELQVFTFAQLAHINFNHIERQL